MGRNGRFFHADFSQVGSFFLSRRRTFSVEPCIFDFPIPVFPRLLFVSGRSDAESELQWASRCSLQKKEGNTVLEGVFIFSYRNVVPRSERADLSDIGQPEDPGGCGSPKEGYSLLEENIDLRLGTSQPSRGLSLEIPLSRMRTRTVR
jgi:hypothetical protein